ncbi:hypothetical protein LAZ67_22001336 [Cordylochernes scorpioides]|uniref:Integrase catalytic domain-containing protein n=1 Tax=Cordylochernes scorpioides TaxID=51811 RepID=A0ABY6LSS9_9ARAC|nr:hypothetical protein LAZ67_22001336 [Cordylochernes scorpioides]
MDPETEIRRIKRLGLNLEKLAKEIEENAAHCVELDAILKKILKIKQQLEQAYEYFIGIRDTDELLLQIEEVTDKYCKLEVKLLRFTQHIHNNANLPLSNNAVNKNYANLPKLELPFFYGKLENWISFSNVFKTTIIDNSQLTNIVKLQYLKTCLKGKALILVNHIPITENNFVLAWDILEKRYDNKRDLIFNLIQRIIDLPKLTIESSTQLLFLVDNSYEIIRSLETLGYKLGELSDIIIGKILSDKLDKTTKRSWNMTVDNNHIHACSELLKFIETYAKALNTSETERGLPLIKRSMKLQVHNLTKANCFLCQQEHGIYLCPTFLDMEPLERRRKVKQLKLCFNCLRNNYSVNQCRSEFKCRKCQGKHNTLIHIDANIHQFMEHTVGIPAIEEPDKNQAESSVKENNDALGVTSIHNTTCLMSNQEDSFVLLSTATIMVMNHQGKYQPCRALIDTASQATLITRDCLKKLNLEPSRTRVELTRIGGQILDRPNGVINLNFTSHFKMSRIFKTNALVVDKKSRNYQKLHTFNCTLNNWEPIFSLWEEELKTQPDPFEDDFNEIHFETTHERETSGRYIVRLPFKDPSLLGESKPQAINCFLRMEQILKQQPQVYHTYKDFMQEYLVLGHMNEVKGNGNDHKAFYLPHHPIIKEKSSTTKLRVVINASAKTTTGYSLEDILHTGPKLQKDIFPLLLRFQSHPIAISADITKMYRQILVHPEDTRYQRIIWRDESGQGLKEYELKTLTYRTSCVPFLAIRVLKQLAHDEQIRFPTAEAILKSDFYVDDLLTGCETIENGRKLIRELDQLLQAGGFKLRQWASNKPTILDTLQETDKSTFYANVDRDNTLGLNLLGINWNPRSDEIGLRKIKIIKNAPTKRNILSQMAKIYDPLGWFAPVMLKIKLMIQTLWAAKLTWDEPIPVRLQESWKALQNDLASLHQLVYSSIKKLTTFLLISLLQILFKCIKCARFRTKAVQQLMGNLPTSRTNWTRPFTKTGIDFAGPVIVKTSNLRNARCDKAYIALFICMFSKAIHIELISNLTTEAFLAALRRFIGRRGRPAEINTDNATNFVGAYKNLRKLFNSNIHDFASSEEIKWNFIPPSSPHFGGLWEAGIKSVKYHLRRIVGKTKLTFEELTTVLTQIESCLNSRPLCPLTDDPEDLNALTAGHFLIGMPLTAVPSLVREGGSSLKGRWQLVEQIKTDFWKRWSCEYFYRLQNRPKWLKPVDNIKIGTLVLLKEDNLPPLKWRMGRINQVYPGEDGLVRVVSVKTADGDLRRAVAKIGSEKEQRWRNKPASQTKQPSNLSPQQETIFTEETPPQRTSAYPLTDRQRREQADRANDSRTSHTTWKPSSDVVQTL